MILRILPTPRERRQVEHVVKWPWMVLHAAALSLPVSGDAQVRLPTRTIELSALTCQSCGQVVPGVKIADQSRDGALRGLPRNLIQDHRGRFFVINQGGGAPQVFDGTGRFIRLLGSEGDGPGEFRHAGAVVPLLDGGVAVYDLRQSRLSVFDAELKYRRSRATVLRTADAALWKGDTLMVTASLNSPAAFGFPVHQTTLEGDSIKSFSFEPLSVVPRGAPERWKVVAAGDRYCVSRENRLAIACAKSGEAPVEYHISASWFRDGFAKIDSGAPPAAVFRSMAAISPTLIALVVLVPDPEFRKAIQYRRGADGTTALIDLNGYYDSRILILDLTSERLVASFRVSQALMYSTGRGGFASVDEDAGEIQVWRVRLAR